MDDNFSPRVKDVIAYSKEEALRLGHDFIGTEHLMLGLLRDGNGKAISILDALDVDLDHLRRKVEILSPANPNSGNSQKDKKNLHLTRQAESSVTGVDRVHVRVRQDEVAERIPRQRERAAFPGERVRRRVVALHVQRHVAAHVDQVAAALEARGIDRLTGPAGRDGDAVGHVAIRGERR